MKVTQRIVEIRTAKHISQKEMAEKLNVSPAYYNKLEKRDTSLSIDQISMICDCLQITIMELLFPSQSEDRRLRKSKICIVINDLCSEEIVKTIDAINRITDHQSLTTEHRTPNTDN